jgi:hypothetical protein
MSFAIDNTKLGCFKAENNPDRPSMSKFIFVHNAVKKAPEKDGR